LAFHQQTADELGGDQLGGSGEEGLRERWERLVAMGVARCEMVEYNELRVIENEPT